MTSNNYKKNGPEKSNYANNQFNKKLIKIINSPILDHMNEEDFLNAVLGDQLP